MLAISVVHMTEEQENEYRLDYNEFLGQYCTMRPDRVSVCVFCEYCNISVINCCDTEAEIREWLVGSHGDKATQQLARSHYITV